MKEKQNALAKRKTEKRGNSSLLQKILAHKVLILIIVAILVVGSVVAFFVFGRKSSDNGYNNYLAMTQIRLYADKTSFYIGDEATSNFSVVIPSELSGEKLDIYNQSGEKVYSMDAKDMTLDKNGDLTCSIPMQINTETDGMQTFTAVAGQYFSSELSVFVTPHITLEQVMKSYEVGADVSAYLEKEYADEEDAEKVAKAAEKYLKKDERVGGVAIHGTDVYYSTVDMVAGMIKCAPQDPDMLGSGSSTEQKTAVSGYVPPVGSAAVGNSVSARQTSFCEDSNIISAYNEPNGAIVKNNLIDSGNTGTNGNVLILRPATNVYLLNLPCFEKLNSGAELIKNTAEGVTVEEKKDDDAVRALLCKELANYGTIILHGHGGKIVDSTGYFCGNSFLMYNCFYNLSEKDEDRGKNQLAEKIEEYAKIDYQYQKKDNPETADYDSFFSKFYGKVDNPLEWTMYFSYERVTTSEETKTSSPARYQGEIFITSNYLMNLYQNVYFDNAVVYFGTCYALKYEKFNQWLINHGFKLVLGYENTVENVMSLYDFKDVVDEMAKISIAQKWRTKNPLEACENTENRLTSLFENFVQTDVFRKIIPKFTHDDTIMLFWGNPEFFYSGTGSISGKVMYKPDDSDTGKAKDTPCEGATVTAYLYHNKQFVEQKKIKTNSKGEFTLNGIRCGAYVLVITDSEGNSKKVSIVADNKDNDGGTVYLEKRKIISQPVGEVVEYNDALYYWKERVFDDSYHETKLVCYKDGKEKVLFDTKSIPDEWDIGFYGDGKIAIANDRIFFIVCDIDGGAIYSCDLNGKNAKKIGVGDSLLGLSLDNNQLVVDHYPMAAEPDDWYYTLVNTKKNTASKKYKGNTNYDVMMYNGVIYYPIYKASKRVIDLYKANPDGSDKIKLGTFKTPKYDKYTSPFIAQALFPVIDGNEYIYFSYGSVSGTGNFFGDSRIARAKLDGSEYKVVDSSQDNDLGTVFSLDDDGSVKLSDINITYSYEGLLTSYYVYNKDVYSIDPIRGNGTLVLSYNEYEKYYKALPNHDSYAVESVDIFGDKAYIRMSFCYRKSTNEPYDADVLLFEKDLNSGKVRSIYKYK